MREGTRIATENGEYQRYIQRRTSRRCQRQRWDDEISRAQLKNVIVERNIEVTLGGLRPPRLL